MHDDMKFLLQSDAAENLDKLIVPDSVQKAKFAETVHRLTNIDLETLLSNVVSEACWVLIKIAIALLIYFVGRWFIRWIIRIMDRAFERRKVDRSLQTFLRSLVKVILMIGMILIVVQTLGINTSSFVALFASAGLAIGMALSGTLQNFAGGVILLLLRPYKVGDYITSQGQSGFVASIGLFSTKIHTSDNRTIYIPNNAISSSIIDNYTQSETRRLSWTVSISYGDDVDVARAEILKILGSDERVKSEPALPVVYIEALADSSVNLTVRAWVDTVNYWEVFFLMNERFYKELPKVGINFPFPQMDVHMKKD